MFKICQTGGSYGDIAIDSIESYVLNYDTNINSLTIQGNKHFCLPYAYCIDSH